jgi:hypothetical protein
MDKIKLNSKVVVSDPCYTIPTWCQAVVDGVLPGNYNVFCKKHDLGDWGVRNSMLLVIHEDHVNDTLEWESHPATIGVDSGQCGFFSSESYRNDSIADRIGLGDGDISFFSNFPHEDEGGKWYTHMASRTLGVSQWGVYDEGAVCSSGVGDGSYMLFTTKDEFGNIIGMAVDFLIEGPEDEEDDTNNFIDFEFYKEEEVK